MATEVEPSVTEGTGLVSGGNNIGNGMDLFNVGYQQAELKAELKKHQNYVKFAVYPRETLAGELVLAKRDIKARKNELDIDTISKKRQAIKTKRDEIEKEEDPKKIVALIARVKALRAEITPIAKKIKEDTQLGGMHEGLRGIKKDLDEKIEAVRRGLGELGYQI